MKITQITTLAPLPSPEDLAHLGDHGPQLVLVFGAARMMDNPELLTHLRAALPHAVLAGCSTAGEIGAGGVSDASLVLTALRFDAPGVSLATTELASMDDSHAAGTRLAGLLQHQGLRAVLLFGQGVGISGSALIDGLAGVLPEGVAISGELAGDGGAFVRTLTLSTKAVSDRQLVAVGLHGERMRAHHGSFHGWEPFGPARRVTRAAGNVLYALDQIAASLLSRLNTMTE